LGKINAESLWCNRYLYRGHEREIKNMLEKIDRVECKLRVLSTVKAIAKAKLTERLIHIEIVSITGLFIGIVITLISTNVFEDLASLIAIGFILFVFAFIIVCFFITLDGHRSACDIIIEICEKKTRELESQQAKEEKEEMCKTMKTIHVTLQEIINKK